MCECVSCSYANPAASVGLPTPPTTVSSASFSILSIFSTSEDIMWLHVTSLHTEPAHSKCSVSAAIVIFIKSP